MASVFDGILTCSTPFLTSGIPELWHTHIPYLYAAEPASATLITSIKLVSQYTLTVSCGTYAGQQGQPSVSVQGMLKRCHVLLCCSLATLEACRMRLRP
jgi:hypothetical protein